jgi:CheY-like chemotaxis protein
VLVVEDQAGVREYVAAALHAHGYQVVGAENAREALRRCEQQHFDLALIDLVMPNMSGRELAGRLSSGWPGIKMAFMSGYAGDVIGSPGEPEAAIPFIQKPFSPEQLAAKVAGAIGDAERRARILVVDDEAGVRKYLRTILEGGGYEVIEAENGKQALDRARAERLDLIVTDLAMHEQEGIEAIRALSEDGSRIGIIAVSGIYDGQRLEFARLLGAQATLSKPVGSDLLLAKVAEALRSGQRGAASQRADAPLERP